MIFVVALAILSVANGASVNTRSLQTMDAASLQTFLGLFRKTLLDKIAMSMNDTVDLSKDLKAKMDVCKPLIDNKVESCKSCAKSKCSADPSFTDYLNLVNPYTYLKGPIDDISGSLGDVVDLLGDGASGFLNSMKDLGSSVTGTTYEGLSSMFGGLESGINALGDGVLDAGSAAIDTASLIGDGLTDIGNSIGDGLTDAGHAIEHVGSSIGHAIGSVFGKKREIDAQTRQCMEKCESCKPLLLPTQSDMITDVCGGEIVKLNKTIQEQVQKIQTVYNYALDKANPIITELKFDPASMDGKMQLTNVHLTVHLNGNYVSYKTGVMYAMMDLPTTARNMALEYWSKAQ